MSSQGTVKSWSDEKGFGFIIPKGGGNDVFVHRKAIGMNASMIAGKEVRYEFQMEQGKPKATTVMGEGVKRMNLPTPGMQHGFANKPMGGMQMGTVKSWVAEKGYGFIRTSNPSDGDLFVLNTQARGNLVPGAKVTYTLGVNPRNQKPWAENVTMVGETGGYPGAYDQGAAFGYGGAAAWQGPPYHNALSPFGPPY